jgi:segregation and condensation protein B
MKPEKKVELRNIIEGALLAAGRPLSVDELLALFPDDDRPERGDLRKALDMLQAEFEGRGIELKEVASGFRIQVRKELAPWIGRLWEERPARYSRALLETIALVAYRQPITRGEIEEVRGVTVSTHIIRTLQERGWIRIVGHRDVPGHPEMFGTTREFLDYFSLKSLDELPTLAQLRDIESINAELDFGDGNLQAQAEVVPAAPAAAPRLAEDEASQRDDDDGEAGVTTH